jgi:hypothetical protein
MPVQIPDETGDHCALICIDAKAKNFDRHGTQQRPDQEAVSDRAWPTQQAACGGTLRAMPIQKTHLSVKGCSWVPCLLGGGRVFV